MELTAYNEVNLGESRKKYLLSLFHIQSHSFVRYIMQVKADILWTKHVFAEIFFNE